eukprot:GHVP01002967.1.p1 GENE.GHVP01002967.1~~GHVP01002967.1.p1  ORF type:complete len:221 (+),score=26.81 GHVP01002967.1:43-705(+)
MTSNLAKLQKAALHNHDSFVLVPEKYKHCYLLSLLDHFGTESSTIIFSNQCESVIELAIFLRHSGFLSVPLMGKLKQQERMAALGSFRKAGKNILVATDVGSRGLDIPLVDVVVNFDVPIKKQDYVHRVGRTARAGSSGTAVTIVSQYDVVNFQKVEGYLKRPVDKFEAVTEVDYMARQDSAIAALRSAQAELALARKRDGSFSIQKGKKTMRKNTRYKQ